MENKSFYKRYDAIINLFIFLFVSFLIFVFFAAFKVILAPLLFSILLAYLLDPVLKEIEKLKKKVDFFNKKIPSLLLNRGVLSLILVLLFLLLIIGLLGWIIPIIVNQFNDFTKNLPDLLETASKSGSKLSEWFDKHFKIPSAVKINLTKEIEKELMKFLSGLSSIIPSLFSNLYSIVLSILYLILIPIFTFYILKELPYIKKFLDDLVPSRMRKEVRIKVKKVNDVVSTFVRGQLIISLGLAIAYSIGLSLIKLPFAILVGIISGLGDIVPYLGTLFGVLLSVIIAGFYFHSFKAILLVLLVFAIIKIVEDWLIYPKLIGDRVGIHPLIIILIIIFAGEYFGITGMILAIPFAGVLKIFLYDVYKWYKRSFLYNKEVEISLEEQDE